MTSRSLILAVNPQGGTKRGLGTLERVKPVFESAEVDLDIRETEYAGHAGDMINGMDLSGYDGFCLIGGDGTLHEVINGLLTRDDEKTILSAASLRVRAIHSCTIWTASIRCWRRGES